MVLTPGDFASSRSLCWPGSQASKGITQGHTPILTCYFSPPNYYMPAFRGKSKNQNINTRHIQPTTVSHLTNSAENICYLSNTYVNIDINIIIREHFHNLVNISF